MHLLIHYVHTVYTVYAPTGPLRFQCSRCKFAHYHSWCTLGVVQVRTTCSSTGKKLKQWTVRLACIRSHNLGAQCAYLFRTMQAHRVPWLQCLIRLESWPDMSWRQMMHYTTAHNSIGTHVKSPICALRAPVQICLQKCTVHLVCILLRNSGAQCTDLFWTMQANGLRQQ